jgi:hypothetical protein
MAVMRGAIVVVALAGCLAKPEPPGDAFCDGVAFPDEAALLPGLEQGVTGDPTITEDLLEAFFTVGSTSEEYEVGTARRASDLDTFGPISTLGFSTPGEADYDPNLTADGLTMVFISERAEGRRAYMTTRANRGVAWSSAAKVPGLVDVTIHSLDLSPDGATIYFVDIASQLRVAHRDGAGLYSVDEMAYFADALWPSVSGDGLVLYHSSGSLIQVATRTTTFEPFLPSPPLAITLADPDVTADGEMLVMKWNDGVGYVRRDCVP